MSGPILLLPEFCVITGLMLFQLRTSWRSFSFPWHFCSGIMIMPWWLISQYFFILSNDMSMYSPCVNHKVLYQVCRSAGFTLSKLMFIIAGLSDEIRANFSVMKDLAQHTRISPAARAQNLEKFMTDMNNNPEAQQELSSWNMQFNKSLLQMSGRCLGAEGISMNWLCCC